MPCIFARKKYLGSTQLLVRMITSSDNICNTGTGSTNVIHLFSLQHTCCSVVIFSKSRRNLTPLTSL